MTQGWYAAIDTGTITGAVYGIGESIAEAQAAARKEGADGELQIVPCSEQAAMWIEEYGGAPSPQLLVGPEGVLRLGEEETRWTTSIGERFP